MMKTGKTKRLILPLALLAIVTLLYVSGAFNMLDFHVIQGERDVFADFARRHYGEAVTLFCLVYIVGVICWVPVGMVMGLLAGYIFGLWVGTLLVIFSSMTGGTCLFLLAKTSLGALLRRKMGGFYAKIEDNMQKNAISYLLFMRLVPVLPYPVINILPALFNIRLSTFLITSVVGMIPGVLVLVNLGQALAYINSPTDLLSTQLLLAFGFLGLLSLVPVAWRKFVQQRRGLQTELQSREAA